MRAMLRLLAVVAGVAVVAVAMWTGASLTGLTSWLAGPAPSDDTTRYYVVTSSVDGQPEYLYDIAVRTLGDGNRYRQIFELNRDRTQPDGRRLTDVTALRPGWILVLPDDATGPGVRIGAPPAEPDAGPPVWLLALVGGTVLVMVVLAVRVMLGGRRRPVRAGPAPPTSSAPSAAPLTPPVDPFSGPIVVPTQPKLLASLTTPKPAIALGPAIAAEPASGWHRDSTPTVESRPVADLLSPVGPAVLTAVAGPAPAEAPPAPAEAPPAPAEAPDAVDAADAAHVPAGTAAQVGGAATGPPAGEPSSPKAANQPRPGLAVAQDFHGEIYTDDAGWQVRLTGDRIGGATPAWQWLTVDDDPSGLMPVVLGHDGGRRLCVDLARTPSTFTITGPLEACREQARRIMAQLRAAGRTTVVVGGVMGEEWLPRYRQVDTFPDDVANLPAGIVVTAGLDPVDLPAARELATRTDGRTVAVVIGPVLRSGWSMSVNQS